MNEWMNEWMSTMNNTKYSKIVNFCTMCYQASNILNWTFNIPKQRNSKSGYYSVHSLQTASKQTMISTEKEIILTNTSTTVFNKKLIMKTRA